MALMFRCGKLIAIAVMVLISMKAEAINQWEDDFYPLCKSPAIYIFEHFLSDQECNHIILLAYPYLSRSAVVDPESADDLVDHRRTSQGMWLEEELSDPIVKSIQRRIAKITQVPEGHYEDIQVLHYDVGQEYQPHYDYFDIDTPGGLFHINHGGQRIATFMIYLSDTEEGGETIFPKAGIKIQPQKGKAVLFFNVDPNGKEDPMSFHGGAPVLKGEKWIMTRWIRSGILY